MECDRGIFGLGIVIEGAHRGEALGAVAGLVGGAGGITAIGDLEAVRLGGVTFPQVAFRDAVEAEEQVIVVLVEVGFGCGTECGDVVGAVVIGLLDRELE